MQNNLWNSVWSEVCTLHMKIKKLCKEGQEGTSHVSPANFTHALIISTPLFISFTSLHTWWVYFFSPLHYMSLYLITCWMIVNCCTLNSLPLFPVSLSLIFGASLSSSSLSTLHYDEVHPHTLKIRIRCEWVRAAATALLHSLYSSQLIFLPQRFYQINIYHHKRWSLTTIKLI